MGKVTIICGEDSQEIADSLATKLEKRGIKHALVHDAKLPGNTDVLAFILSDDTIENILLHQVIEKSLSYPIPVLPIVRNRTRFRFDDLPDTLRGISQLNAVGWHDDPEPGSGVLDALVKLMGRELPERDKKIFISYCRADGQDLADKIYAWFSAKGYRVFQDTESLEGGDVVEEQIDRDLVDRDFTLLLDTPLMSESGWVMSEIEYSLANQIKVLVVHHGPHHGIELALGFNRFTWQPGSEDGQHLVALEKEIERHIHGKERFDAKISKAMKDFIGGSDLILKKGFHRDFYLIHPRKGRLRISRVDGGPSLERFYLLSESVREEPDLRGGCLVYNGGKRLDLQKKAQEWARGDQKISMISPFELLDILPFLD